MYTINKYLNDTRQLASNLIIKHHDIGIVINQGLLRQYGITSSNDYNTWKYYLNLSGSKHSTNNNVMFTTLETNEKLALTVSNLLSYPITLNSFKERLGNYDALITEYPDDVLYINGCISPVNITKAIAAQDGDIVGYSSKYIEPQEYSLIRELSREIRLYFTRWYIKDYNITDELYMASVLAVLYASIPNIIMNIRTRDSHTAEAHSFHIEHFFRSHLDLWDSVKVLKPDTIGWLHKNLITLINNVGSSATFDSLIKNVFTPNKIGLGRYTLTPSDVIKTTNPVVNASSYTVSDINIIIEKLNSSYTNIATTIPLIEVVKKELQHSAIKASPDSNIINNLTNDEAIRIGKSKGVSQYTKIIDFGEIALFKLYTNGLIETILDNWLYLSSIGKYTYSTMYTDPITNKTYNLDAYNAIILFYRLLAYKINNSDPVISNIKYRYRVANHLSVAALNNKLLNATGNAIAIDTIISNLPTLGNNLNTTNDFSNYIDQQISLYQKVWVLDSNADNSFLSANIKKMVNSTYLEGDVLVSPTSASLSSILNTAGIPITLTPGYDIDTSLIALFKTFTGFDLHPDIAITELYSKFEIILEKLSSYSIQTTPPIINSGELSAPHTTIAAIHSDTGYIQVTSGTVVKIYEDNLSTIAGEGNDFIDNYDITNVNTPALYMYGSKNSLNITAGVGYAKDVVASSTPNTYAEVMYGDYIKYGPTTVAVADDHAGNTPVGFSNGYVNTISGPVVDTNILVSNTIGHTADVAIKTTANIYAEILRADYSIYVPNTKAISPSSGSNVPVAVSGGNIANITSVSRSNEVLVTAGNNIVTPKPVANAEVLGRPPIV